MKKRLISLFLALVMVLSLAMPALAAGEEIPASPAEAAADVYAAPETPAEAVEEAPAMEAEEEAPAMEAEEDAPAAVEAPETVSVSVPDVDGAVAVAASSADWRQAYLDYVNEDRNSVNPNDRDWEVYNLMYIGSDGIPWLLIYRGTMAGGCKLCYMYGSSLKVWGAYPTYYEYAEGADAFMTIHYATALTTSTLYVVRNGEIREHTTCGYGSSATGTKYFWGDDEVSKSTYDSRMANLRSQYMSSGPVHTVDYFYGYTYDEIVAQLGGSTAKKSGWVLDDGLWYYYKNGSMVTGWVKDGGKWYWMTNEGWMATGLKFIDGKYYYFNKSGVMQTGWAAFDGYWYYCGPDGAALSNQWKKIGGKWYWFNQDGEMACNGRKNINGTWYCFDASGAMMTGWVLDGSSWYYYTGSGAMAKGWLKDGRTWYYLDPSTGVMTANTTRTIGGKTYMFSASGAMYTGWISLGGGDYYYADGSGALLKNSWIKSGKYWYWLKADGLMARNETLTIGGVKYTFNDGGAWTNTGAGTSSTANEQYRAIVQNAASYFPGLEDDPYVTGYKYALVQMDPGDSTKTLLLAVEEGGLLNIYLYRYEPSTGKMLHPKDMLSTGVAPIGGFRGTLGMCADGYGLISTTWNGMSGQASIERVTMSGDSLRYDEVWTGRIDQAPDYGGREIKWYSTTDLSPLS